MITLTAILGLVQKYLSTTNFYLLLTTYIGPAKIGAYIRYALIKFALIKLSLLHLLYFHFVPGLFPVCSRSVPPFPVCSLSVPGLFRFVYRSSRHFRRCSVFVPHCLLFRLSWAIWHDSCLSRYCESISTWPTLLRISRNRRQLTFQCDAHRSVHILM